jgi:DNA-binding transcriptional ArsR family regulator
MDAVEAEDGRLSSDLAAKLDSRMQDALDHPLRRELMRAFHRGPKWRSIVELQAALPPLQPSQIGYHLQVLREAGIVASQGNGSGPAAGDARFTSDVIGDGRVRAVLRATERWDRQRREALERRKSSPFLTMFRAPRPVHTIRLRGRRSTNGNQGSE